MLSLPLTATNAAGGELMETRGEIRDVARKVACCEAALEGCGSYLGITDRVREITHASVMSDVKV